MIRILVADDHLVVRRGLRHILEDQPDMTVAGEAGNGAEAIAFAQSEHYDLVLLDISMPRKNGLDVLKEIKRVKPRLEVIVFSIHSEDEYAVRALRAGAAAYLTKDCCASELVAAIRRAAEGRKYVTPSLAEKLAVSLDATADKNPHEALSDREYQVFTMLAAGSKVSDIARALYLSPTTVSTHRCHILAKLGLRNNAELMYYAVRHGLVENGLG